MHKILLADDSKLTLAVEKSFLEARDFKVFVTTRAEEVTRLVKTLQPDLIVLDYEMGEMNGDEVCRRLKADPETEAVPILVISIHEPEEISERCLQAGAAAVTRKAEGRDALLDSVAGLLGLRRRRGVRAACHLRIGIQGDGKRLKGQVHNISYTGLYLTTREVLTKNAALQLTFNLPNHDPKIRVLGEVVRSETLVGGLYGYGVQFLQAPPASIQALKAFVAKTV
ncbi:MAG: response regulator [Acidobacteriota bacterium]